MNGWILALFLIRIGEHKLQGCDQRQEPEVKIICVAIFKKVHTLKINQQGREQDQGPFMKSKRNIQCFCSMQQRQGTTGGSSS